MVQRFLVALAVALVLRPTPAAAQDDWFGRDKALHFGATFVLAGAGYAGGAALSREPVVRLGTGAILAMGAGIGKEMADRIDGGDPSLKDLTWDAVGTATGLLTAWLFDHYLFSRPPMPEPPPQPLPFPQSLCHRCAAPPRYVKTPTSTFILCPLLPEKYPRQPVLSCPLFRPRDEE